MKHIVKLLLYTLFLLASFGCMNHEVLVDEPKTDAPINSEDLLYIFELNYSYTYPASGEVPTIVNIKDNFISMLSHKLEWQSYTSSLSEEQLNEFKQSTWETFSKYASQKILNTLNDEMTDSDDSKKYYRERVLVLRKESTEKIHDPMMEFFSQTFLEVWDENKTTAYKMLDDLLPEDVRQQKKCLRNLIAIHRALLFSTATKQDLEIWFENAASMGSCKYSIKPEGENSECAVHGTMSDILMQYGITNTNSLMYRP